MHHNFSPAVGSHVSDASGWQVSELLGTWGLKKEKILQTLAAYAIGTKFCSGEQESGGCESCT